MKVGYDMGKVTPYLATGVLLTKGSAFVGATDPGTSFNALFSGPGAYQALGYVAGASTIRSTTRSRSASAALSETGAAAIGH